jgi:ubiquinone biosynthesis UbiH/UbiF/VisC/COQ6 family hydroxylase
LKSELPHRGKAWQWFGAPAVLGLLPFDRPSPGHSFGLVWSLPEAQAQAWLEASPDAFEQGLAEATAGQLGRLTLASERMSWPLAMGHAEALCGPGWALLGDAAHQVHPLAGQGLNLGLADVQAMAEVIAAREPWRELGDVALLRRYARNRSLATFKITAATDGLWNLFARDQASLRELRNLGLTLFNRLPPVRRWLTQQALGA